MTSDKHVLLLTFTLRSFLVIFSRRKSGNALLLWRSCHIRAKYMLRKATCSRAICINSGLIFIPSCFFLASSQFFAWKANSYLQHPNIPCSWVKVCCFWASKATWKSPQAKWTIPQFKSVLAHFFGVRSDRQKNPCIPEGNLPWTFWISAPWLYVSRTSGPTWRPPSGSGAPSPPWTWRPPRSGWTTPPSRDPSS